MTALTLTLRETPSVRLDLSPLAPALAGGDLAALARLPLALGNQKVALGELFQLHGDDPGDVVLEGELRRVDGIGARWTAGRLRVHGGAGDFLALEMQGGTIEVQGSVGNYAAAALRRGTLSIVGDAGSHLGGALPGAMKGMAGGQVLVHGSVGERAADRMRRGAVLVSGRVGDYAGARMLAGTLLALGGCGAHAGYGMRRGTLLVRGRAGIDATFADCGRHTLPIVHLLFRSWQPLGAPFAELAAQVRPVQRWMGDRAAEGKGEILLFDPEA